MDLLTLESTVKALGPDQTSTWGGYGKWIPYYPRTARGKLEPCMRGIHFCTLKQAPTWLAPELWQFEDLTPAETIRVYDKSVTRKGQVTTRIETWHEITARAYAADCAERVVYLAEDDRIQSIIDEIKAYLRGPGDRLEQYRIARTAEIVMNEKRTGTAAYYAVRACWSAISRRTDTDWAKATRGTIIRTYDAMATAHDLATGRSERTWQAERLLEYLRGDIDQDTSIGRE